MVMERNEKIECIGLGDSLDGVDGEEGVLGHWAGSDNNNQASEHRSWFWTDLHEMVVSLRTGMMSHSRAHYL